MADRRIDYRIFLLIAAGLLLAVACLFISLELAFMLTAGLAFCLFTFYQIEMSLALFILGMSITPHEYWNNLYILVAAFLYCAVYFILYVSGRRKGIDKRFLFPSFLFFVLFCVISLYMSNYLGDSLRTFVILFSCLIFFVLIQNIITDRRSFNMVMLMIFAAVLISSLFGLYQFIRGVEIKAEFVDSVANQDLPGRVFSTMNNPNNYAEFLTMLFPLMAAYVLNLKSDTKRVVFTGILALSLLVLGLTFSRASYLAVPAAAFVLLVLLNRKLIPVVIALSMIAIPLLPSVILNRLSTIGNDTSSQYRLLIWNAAGKMLKENWLTGIGIGPEAFTHVYRDFCDSAAVNAMHSHNTILNIWLELGIFGLAAFLAFIIRIARECFRLCKKTVEKYTRNYMAAFLASIAAFIGLSVVEHVWFYPRVMLTFWVICGLAVSAVRIAGNEE